jgi:hypothetical protein
LRSFGITAGAIHPWLFVLFFCQDGIFSKVHLVSANDPQHRRVGLSQAYEVKVGIVLERRADTKFDPASWRKRWSILKSWNGYVFKI